MFQMFTTSWTCSITLLSHFYTLYLLYDYIWVYHTMKCINYSAFGCDMVTGGIKDNYLQSNTIMIYILK